MHIPIYREGIRHEIDKFKISKNTDRNWLKDGYRLFLLISDVIKKRLLRIKSILHIDETWTAVRIKLKGDGTKLGHYFKKYIWCLVNKAEGITYFCYDNDKNDSRGLRPIENFLSEEGVQEACLFFTLCETCKNFSVNFKEYVAYAAKELISGNTDCKR